jgi:glucose/mannose-6-phosphate isomerase
MKQENHEFIDKENMYSVLEKFPEQVKTGYKLGDKIEVKEEVDKIIITGMGGSALPGDFLKSYLYGYKLPIFVNKDYFLPEFINHNTLVFAISYSGNTEETINAYRNALRKGAKIITISSNGKLQQLGEKQAFAHIKIPSGLQPRMAYGYQFFSMLKVLENSGLINNQSKEIEKVAELLKRSVYKEKAKELAEKLVNKILLIYSSERLSIIAYKWKIDFNESAKTHAFSNVFPEMNHNEINAFINIKGNYHVIIIKDENDYMRIRKRMDITKKLIKKRGIPVTEIALTGSSLLTKMFSASYIGDWTSYFLALKYNTDPTPVKMVDELKRSLGGI